MKRQLFLLLFPFGIMSAHANEADTLEMKEVVVTGSRATTDLRYLPATVSIVSREDLRADYQPTVLPTVARLVPSLFLTSRAMMGYGVSGGAAGGLSLRGLTGGAGQLLVLIDGHPQYNGVYGHPISDAYRTLGAERVEVQRGPASVLYGSNAMGGVLNIITRQIPTDGRRTNLTVGAGSYGTVESQVCNQVRKGKFSSTVGAEYNRSDNHRPRMGFEQYGGSAKLAYDLSAHWKASANTDITHFRASTPGTEQAPLWDADQWITRGAAALAMGNHYGRANGTISLYSNFGRHKIDDGTNDLATPTQRYFRSRDNLAGVSLYESARLFDGNLTTFGFDYQHIFGKAYYTSKATGEVLDTPNKQSGKSHRNEVAGYVDFRQDVATWLTLDAGLRINHHSVTGTEWVPQGGIVVRPIANGEAKATVGKGFRNPTMREMYLYPPSNEDLTPERTLNYELAWTHRLAGNRLSYGANLYHIRGDNMIQTQMVEGRPRNVNTGKIENTGFEITIDYHITPCWALATNHSYLHMKHPVLAAPTYKGLASIRYHKERWSATSNLQYIAGLYTATGVKEQKENFCLFSASVGHNVWRGLTLWLRGETLIGARSYEIIQGYPLPHATLMGGLSWDF